MRLNQLDGLPAFWKVAQHRGFSAAAATLEVSPSAPSQAIRHLETRLDVRVLKRTTRSVRGQRGLARILQAPSGSTAPSDLVHHNCVRFRFSGSEELEVDGRIVEYEIGGNLTISDSMFSVEAALEGVGLSYTFEQLALAHIKAKRLKRVLSGFSPTFPGFYLYYPSRRQQPSKLKAFVDYALAHSRER